MTRAVKREWAYCWGSCSNERCWHRSINGFLRWS